jgi:hypothetical protein
MLRHLHSYIQYSSTHICPNMDKHMSSMYPGGYRISDMKYD